MVALLSFAEVRAIKAALFDFFREAGDAYRVAAGDLVFKLKAISLYAAAEKPMSELLMLYRFAAEILPRKDR